MQKKWASWIYRLPVLRDLVAQINDLIMQNDNLSIQINDLITQNKKLDAKINELTAQNNGLFLEWQNAETVFSEKLEHMSKENALLQGTQDAWITKLNLCEKQEQDNLYLIKKLDAEKGKIKADYWDTRKEFLTKITNLQQKIEVLTNSEKQLRTELQKTKTELYKEINYKYYKSLSPSQYEKNLKEWFFEKTGQHLNLENPQTYNEKIQWLKLYDNTPIKARLADKLLVRDYVKAKIGEQYLIPLLGIWDRVEDIDFSALPNQYALKVTHGAAWNIIVRDNNSLNIEEATGKLQKWITTDFAFCSGLELHYSNITPKIIAEEYLENGGGELNDYKIFCFNGKAKYIMYLTDRTKGLKMAFYDLDWNLMPFVYNYERLETPIARPDNLQEMLTIAEKLSHGFAHVRVDLYRLNDGSLKFGELTFTSFSGICKWNPPEYDKILGDLITLPQNSN